MIGEARPSRTGLDGILRPRDDHHAVLVAWHYWRDGGHRARDLLDLHVLCRQVPEARIEATARAWGVERVWRNTSMALDAISDPAGADLRHRRLTGLAPVPNHTRRTRQWWGLAMGGVDGAIRELRERAVRNRQRRAPVDTGDR